jgi:hypothetical protein
MQTDDPTPPGPGSEDHSGARTEVHYLNGDSDVVHGEIEHVAKALSDAARSGQSRLAWLDSARGPQRIAVNPAHVTSLRDPEDD